MHLERTYTYMQGEIELEGIPISGFRSCCGQSVDKPNFRVLSGLRVTRPELRETSKVMRIGGVLEFSIANRQTMTDAHKLGGCIRGARCGVCSTR